MYLGRPMVEFFNLLGCLTFFVFVQFVAQGAHAYAQNLGRVSAVAVGVSQGPVDHQAFGLLEGRRQAQGVGATGCGAASSRTHRSYRGNHAVFE
jgi:hypothetical protein